MCQILEEGGLSMINVDDLQKSFLLSWAHTHTNNDRKR